MSRIMSAFAAFVCLISGVDLARAQSLPTSSFAETGAETSIPFGWVDFCQRYKNECVSGERAPRDIVLTQRSLKDFERVNRYVNKSIQAVSDLEHWGVVDQWDYPTDGKGDCEDFALQKRRMLMDMGYPMQALLMTVVKDKQGAGHAVLTIKTNQGEFVLDNLDDHMLDWRRTGYRFVKRQSQEDANIWIAIGAPTSAPAYVSK